MKRVLLALVILTGFLGSTAAMTLIVEPPLTDEYALIVTLVKLVCVLIAIAYALVLALPRNERAIITPLLTASLALLLITPSVIIPTPTGFYETLWGPFGGALVFTGIVLSLLARRTSGPKAANS